MEVSWSLPVRFWMYSALCVCVTGWLWGPIRTSSQRIYFLVVTSCFKPTLLTMSPGESECLKLLMFSNLNSFSKSGFYFCNPSSAWDPTFSSEPVKGPLSTRSGILRWWLTTWSRFLPLSHITFVWVGLWRRAIALTLGVGRAGGRTVLVMTSTPMALMGFSSGQVKQYLMNSSFPWTWFIIIRDLLCTENMLLFNMGRTCPAPCCLLQSTPAGSRGCDQLLFGFKCAQHLLPHQRTSGPRDVWELQPGRPLLSSSQLLCGREVGP